MGMWLRDVWIMRCSKANSRIPRATVLVGKLKFIIFEQVVHEDDEFAHAGGHGNQWFLSRSQQARIKLFENAVMAHGTQGGHVERTPYGVPPATDVAGSFLGSAIAVVRGHSRQGGGGLCAELSQFGHFSQDRGGHDRTHAGDGFQPPGFVRQAGIRGNEGGDGLIALFDLFFQRLLELAGLAHTERIGVMLGAIVFGGAGVDELSAALRHIGQLLLLGRYRRCGNRLEGGTVVSEDGGVNGVGFGALALGAGEVPDTARFNNAHRDVRCLEGAHDGLFVAAGRFANDMRTGLGAQEFEELGVALTVIGQGIKTTRKMELQRELGNIEADMEDGGVVLTHTCKNTSPGDRWSPCSSNGSSLGQWARAKHARGRITPKRMLGEDVPARAVALRPAGRRATPAWLAFASKPSQTNRKIQGEGETGSSRGKCQWRLF